MSNDLSSQLREGMSVVTADGTNLGKVKQVWYGSEDLGKPVPSTEEETTLEVHRGLLGREVLYIPCRNIASVSGNEVHLKEDATTALANPSFHKKPSWIEG